MPNDINQQQGEGFHEGKDPAELYMIQQWNEAASTFASTINKDEYRDLRTEINRLMHLDRDPLEQDTAEIEWDDVLTYSKLKTKLLNLVIKFSGLEIFFKI